MRSGIEVVFRRTKWKELAAFTSSTVANLVTLYFLDNPFAEAAMCGFIEYVEHRLLQSSNLASGAPRDGGFGV